MPYVIEPAAGLTRAVLAFLLDAYDEDEAPNTKGGVDKRTVMRFDPRLAPVKVAVLPLSRNADLSPKARDLAAVLRKRWNVEFDDARAIGRRYRRQDEIGTPFCVTVDFDTLEDNAVTIRTRDSMAQERVGIDAVEGWLKERLPPADRRQRPLRRLGALTSRIRVPKRRKDHEAWTWAASRFGATMQYDVTTSSSTCAHRALLARAPMSKDTQPCRPNP